MDREQLIVSKFAAIQLAEYVVPERHQRLFLIHLRMEI
jgi:hypothetical protein